MSAVYNGRMTKSPRYGFFDMYRGFALIIMAVYHFSFDLNSFGVIREDMNNNEFWLDFRAFIMTSFLALVGISFAFAKTNYKNRGFLKRLGLLALCATIISISSYIMNPMTWIFFGVLHLILVASLMSPLMVKAPRVCLALGVPLVLLPNFYRDVWFLKPGLILSGLSPVKPWTEDFAPFAPWLGVILIGVSAGSVVKMKKPRWAELAPIPGLSFLRRHSLIFYMTHQLVLFPLAWIISKM
ncbi:hypothetical protein BH10BDE1_BH10BDE1_33740 [soil metagenome]